MVELARGACFELRDRALYRTLDHADGRAWIVGDRLKNFRSLESDTETKALGATRRVRFLPLSSRCHCRDSTYGCPQMRLEGLIFISVWRTVLR